MRESAAKGHKFSGICPFAAKDKSSAYRRTTVVQVQALEYQRAGCSVSNNSSCADNKRSVPRQLTACLLYTSNMLITGVIGSTGTTLLLSYSYNWISVGTATTLHFLYPIFVALLCRFCYGEKLGGGKTLALILALLGTCCFMDLHDMEKMGGLLMAVGSGCTYAFYMVLTEKKNLKEINPFVYSFNISRCV